MADFGDRVRARRSAETEGAGLAGREGTVHGFTTPSVTGVDVVGGAPDDHAINVVFDDRPGDCWVRPDLLDVIDRNAGATLRIGDVELVRQADGTWQRRPA